jgi:hypothetical protein
VAAVGEQVVDVGAVAGQPGLHVAEQRVPAIAVAAPEQVGRVVVDGQQNVDGAVDHVEDDPLRFVAGQASVFEDAPAYLVSGATVCTGLSEGAVAGEFADYTGGRVLSGACAIPLVGVLREVPKSVHAGRPELPG